MRKLNRLTKKIDIIRKKIRSERQVNIRAKLYIEIQQLEKEMEGLLWKK